MLVTENLDGSRHEFWADRPEPLSHIDFARTLTVPDSEDARGNLEPYDPRSHPGQWHALRALDGHSDRPGFRFRKFCYLSDAQGGGKSWVLQQFCFHSMVERGRNVIYAIPTRDLGGDIWALKLRPAITGAGLEGYLPLSGPGSRDGSKPRFVPFVRRNGRGGGTLVFMAAGGRGQSGQAALTADRLAIDEGDDWSEPAYYRIQRRVDKNNENAIVAIVSTVKKDDSPYREDDRSLICDLYSRSTQGRLEYRCPHCPAWTRFEFANFKYHGSTPEELDASVGIACASCACTITDSQRRTAMGESRLAMDNPTAEVWGLRVSALDCPWKPLRWLASLHSEAVRALEQTGNHEPLRQFHHDQMAAQYRGDTENGENAEQITPAYLLRRSEQSTWGACAHLTDRGEGKPPTYSRHVAEIPADAAGFVAAIDLSPNRVYWSLEAGALDGRTWSTAWGYEFFDAAQEEMNKQQLWSVLSRVDGLVRGIIEDRPLWYAGVDSNYRTDDVHHWLSLNPKWWPLYGASAMKAAKMSGKDGDRVGDFPGILFLRRPKGWKLKQPATHIDTTPMRQAAQRTFLIPPGEPQAAHLPSGLGSNRSDLAYLQHLCGELWDEKAMKWFTPPSAGRHDWLDCRTYCMALFRYHLTRLSRPSPPRRYGVVGKVG